MFAKLMSSQALIPNSCFASKRHFLIYRGRS